MRSELVSFVDTQNIRLGSQIAAGSLVVEIDCSEAHFASHPLALTWAQRRVLLILLSKRGRVANRETLYREAFGRSMPRGSRAIDIHVGRIRRALQPHSEGIIVTVDRVGYRVDLATLEGASEQHT